MPKHPELPPDRRRGRHQRLHCRLLPADRAVFPGAIVLGDRSPGTCSSAPPWCCLASPSPKAACEAPSWPPGDPKQPSRHPHVEEHQARRPRHTR